MAEGSSGNEQSFHELAVGPLLPQIEKLSPKLAEKERLSLASTGGLSLRVHSSLRGDLADLAHYAFEASYRADELAEKLQCSRRDLRRMISDILDLSSKQWLQQVRQIEVEKRLLGTESLTQIASAVGFSHPKDLSREFRKYHGMTASEYRKAFRKVPNLDI